MRFRDFVEVTRDGLESIAFKLEGDRDLMPMLQIEDARGLSVIGVDPEFFAADRLERFVAAYVVPLIIENQARKVAWAHCAWQAPAEGVRPSEHPERHEILLAVFIDPEVVEHWTAPIIRTGGAVMLGPWQTGPQNALEGPLITAVQEALR